MARGEHLGQGQGAGGGAPKGVAKTPEHRLAMSEAHKGLEVTPDRRDAIIAAARRHWEKYDPADDVRVSVADLEQRLAYKVDLSSATAQIAVCEWMAKMIINDPRVSNAQLAREIKELTRIAAQCTVNNLDVKIAQVMERFLEISRDNEVLREHIAQSGAGERAELPPAPTLTFDEDER